ATAVAAGCRQAPPGGSQNGNPTRATPGRPARGRGRDGPTGDHQGPVRRWALSLSEVAGRFRTDFGVEGPTGAATHAAGPVRRADGSPLKRTGLLRDAGGSEAVMRGASGTICTGTLIIGPSGFGVKRLV